MSTVSSSTSPHSVKMAMPENGKMLTSTAFIVIPRNSHHIRKTCLENEKRLRRRQNGAELLSKRSIAASVSLRSMSVQQLL
ncbi:hypothetical protein BaRGS_00021734 [Batillaria attramentaria]|uniref:Uncharacterized protein n=1 Tax=Batillaria attramentaria TaxID=370345 RepID=A0ABD0KIR3_9CAEN